jgi:hypothetical protein
MVTCALLDPLALPSKGTHLRSTSSPATAAPGVGHLKLAAAELPPTFQLFRPMKYPPVTAPMARMQR